MIILAQQSMESEHDKYCNFDFAEHEKEFLVNKFATEIPALRAKVGVSQGKIAEAVGISRQTYNAYETRARPIPWNVYLALLFYFNNNPGTHNMIRQLNLLPMDIGETELRKASE